MPVARSKAVRRFRLRQRPPRLPGQPALPAPAPGRAACAMRKTAAWQTWRGAAALGCEPPGALPVDRGAAPSHLMGSWCVA